MMPCRRAQPSSTASGTTPAVSTQEFGGGQANAGRAAGDEDGFIFHNQVDALVCRQKWPWHSDRFIAISEIGGS